LILNLQYYYFAAITPPQRKVSESLPSVELAPFLREACCVPDLVTIRLGTAIAESMARAKHATAPRAPRFAAGVTGARNAAQHVL
jgi:hypothetical protein